MLRGGIPRSVRNFPESLSQRISAQCRDGPCVETGRSPNNSNNENNDNTDINSNNTNANNLLIYGNDNNSDTNTARTTRRIPSCPPRASWRLLQPPLSSEGSVLYYNILQYTIKLYDMFNYVYIYIYIYIYSRGLRPSGRRGGTSLLTPAARALRGGGGVLEGAEGNLQGMGGVSKNWLDCALCSILSCSNPHVDRCSNPLPWDPLVP